MLVTLTECIHIKVCYDSEHESAEVRISLYTHRTALREREREREGREGRREGGRETVSSLAQQGAEILVFIHETVHSIRERERGEGCVTLTPSVWQVPPSQKLPSGRLVEPSLRGEHSELAVELG